VTVSARPRHYAYSNVRAIGVYALVLVAIIGAATPASFAYAQDHRGLNSFPHLRPRPPFVPAPDPITDAERGLAPKASDRDLGKSSASVRAIEIYPSHIDLVVSGRVVRSIPTDLAVITLLKAVALIGDDSWISQSSSGAVVVRAALIAETHSHLMLEPPLKTVQLVDTPGVFIGARSAELDIDHVTVKAVGRTVGEGQALRPFVVADFLSTMTISHSTFFWPWLELELFLRRGVDGRLNRGAVDSTFENGYIGVYTDHASNLLLRNNVYSDNALYGLDPHSFSSHLMIVQGLAEGNARHGVIFSNHVTDIVISSLVTKDNGENGIMMDEASSHNLIEHNVVVANRGDGIVTSNSPGNIILDNRVQANRVGIHVSGSSPKSETVTGNTISSNVLAAQGIALTGNYTSNNNGQWIASRLLLIWGVAAGACLVLLPITALLRRRQPHYVLAH
jgi:poly(beta-D-mannuronate) C5 epimerase